MAVSRRLSAVIKAACFMSAILFFDRTYLSKDWRKDRGVCSFSRSQKKLCSPCNLKIRHNHTAGITKMGIKNAPSLQSDGLQVAVGTFTIIRLNCGHYLCYNSINSSGNQTSTSILKVVHSKYQLRVSLQNLWCTIR